MQSNSANRPRHLFAHEKAGSKMTEQNTIVDTGGLLQKPVSGKRIGK